jgi:hypothetical protein
VFSITDDDSNKDLIMNMDRHAGREYYLDMWGSFESRFGSPVVEKYKDRYILRADLAPGGLKAFGGERVIAESKYDTMVYCAPRQGHAPDAIAMIAKEYGKKCVFFMPASKKVSDHQGSLFAYDHCDMRFFKIAAMPVLNSYAKKWAQENKAQYLSFGLTGVPTVTAGLINMCRNISNDIGKDPTEIYCAVSTGTMIRALQIGWPDATPKGIAVARNIHKGERGDAILESATMPFLKRTPVADTMPIPTTGAYDAKAWELFEREGKPGSIFINVGADEHIVRNLEKVNIDNINSQREWHDMGDWNENRAYKVL